MKKKETIAYKKIERISPSQFGSMKNCSYKSILAKAMMKPQLPISPNAYFGSVMHKVLERITKDNITDEEMFINVFSQEVEAMESYLITNGFNQYVPLQKSVQDFGIKKVLLKKHIRINVGSKKTQRDCKPNPEQWISTRDNIIGGFVDLLLESDVFTELVDFKTGAITHDVLDDSQAVFTEIKSEYSDQLKLYAYAYYETKGRYPDKLTLVDLAKQRFDVPYSPEECQKLYEQAKDLLKEVNRSIEEKKFNANVTEQNCKYCLYRPSCHFYSAYLEENDPFSDVIGSLEKVEKHQNGNLSLFIKNNSRSYTVTGLADINEIDLQDHLGKGIGVYNLKKESVENVYSSKKTTMIYEQ